MATHAETVPDTLVLEDHARAALNALTRYVDEPADDRPYMTASLDRDPATLSHSGWDFGSSVGRLVSSITLAREMTGDRETGADVEERLRERLLDMFADDGLNYREETDHGEPRANMHDQRSVLLGLTTWYLATGDEDVRAAADDLCAALKRIAVKEGHPHLAKQDFWYYPATEYTPDGWPSEDAVFLGMNVDPAHTSARLLNPLAKYHEATGNRDALELGRYFGRHTVEYSGSINDDGSFNVGTEFRTGHFHSRMVSVTAVARFAALDDDAAHLAWARDVFEWALEQGTAYGWFPHAMREDYVHKHETCALVDMIELGILLAERGHPSYWGDVERFVRNQLVGSQLLETDWIREADEPADDGHRDVAARSRGAFPGWAAANDFVCDVGSNPDVMTCCVASGTRGLFLAWQNAVTVTETDGGPSADPTREVSVNLLLNRHTPALDVHSWLPHEGRVELAAHEPADLLRVRIPEWADPQRVSLAVDGEDARTHWDGPFLVTRDVHAGADLALTFGVRETETVETAADREFLVEWRADDVLSISPEGSVHPLFADREVHESVGERDADLEPGPAAVRW
ncbi:MAG: hypothetical protein ABEJ42_05485 [Halobacteriaceae archaeon]